MVGLMDWGQNIILWIGLAAMLLIVAGGLCYGLVRGARVMAAGLFCFLAAAALTLYIWLGAPNQPDQPLETRLNKPLEELPPAAILARLESRLRVVPQDSEGWRHLARLRARLGQPAQARDAWRRVLALDGADIEALTSLAMALIAQEEGVVSPQAHSIIEQALVLRPDNPMALYLAGLSAVQAGQKQTAKQHWEKARQSAPEDSPWYIFISGQLAPLAAQ